MEYKVVSVSTGYLHVSIEELASEVNYLIEQGWKPFGGISVSRSEVGYDRVIIMAQAMIKE